MTGLISPYSPSSSIPPEYLEDPEVTVVPSKIIVWARKTLETVGNDIEIPFDTRITITNFSLMTKVLSIDDPPTYA